METLLPHVGLYQVYITQVRRTFILKAVDTHSKYPRPPRRRCPGSHVQRWFQKGVPPVATLVRLFSPPASTLQYDCSFPPDLRAKERTNSSTQEKERGQAAVRPAIASTTTRVTFFLIFFVVVQWPHHDTPDVDNIQRRTKRLRLSRHGTRYNRNIASHTDNVPGTGTDSSTVCSFFSLWVPVFHYRKALMVTFFFFGGSDVYVVLLPAYYVGNTFF